LLIVTLVSSFTVYLFVANNGVHVKSEGELVKAINATKSGSSAIIIFDNDIDLTATITISAHKNITLTSNNNNAFRLVGPDLNTIAWIGASTLYVETDGILILDGIVVTHINGSEGRGIFVAQGGQLFMYSGEISGNAATSKGSVYVGDGYGGGVDNFGVFEMYGGKISDNKALYGGGVSNTGTSAVFTMYGGEISGNTASCGSGIYNWDGVFNRSDGTISDTVYDVYGT
jgi:hypothetical protein